MHRTSPPRTGDVDLHQGASGAARGGDCLGPEAGSDARFLTMAPWIDHRHGLP